MAYYTYKQVRDLLPQHIIDKQGPDYEGDAGYDGDQWSAAADYIIELKDAIAAKDRDLVDAQHILLAANASADAFKRVAEQRQAEIERLQRAVEWIKGHSLAYTDVHGIQWWVVHDGTKQVSKIPADLTDIIIKPTTGASNG